MSNSYDKTLTDASALFMWVEDEGATYECALVSYDAQTGSFVVGSRILEDAGPDKRDAFRRKHDRYLPFVFTALSGGRVEVDGEISVPQAMQCEPLEADDGFGLRFEGNDGTITLLARQWRVTLGDELTLPVERWADPDAITFYGPGPLRAVDLASIPLTIYGNWEGSGQSFGAAFVRGVKAPPVIAPTETLGGAWRIVPAASEPTDARGVWLSGQSGRGSLYAQLERTAESDRTLVRSLVSALAALPAIEWAVTGNELVEDEARRDAWIALNDDE